MQHDFDEAVSLHQAGKWVEAETIYRDLLADGAADPEVLRQLALCVGEQRRYAEALPWALQAVALDPQHAGGRVALAGLYSFLGRRQEARRELERALAISPHMPVARWNHALSLLIHGEWERGWREYRWGVVNRERRLRTLAPEWDPHPACGTLLPEGEGHGNGGARTFFVWAEQGLGDTLQFLRFLPELRRQSGAARIILEVQEALVPLLAGHPFADEVITQQVDGAMPGDWDAHISLLSLPGALGLKRPQDVPGEPYLWTDPEPLPRAGGLQVGLCWAGNERHPNDHYRSLSVAQVEPLLEVKGVEWVSLRPGGNLPGAHHPPLPDFAATARVIAGLDLVVTTDTAVAHLAGALGKELWLLLPYAGDFRWGLPPGARSGAAPRDPGPDRTPWYPTARVFWQPAVGDWASVIERVREALEARYAAA